jgi:hypothetical protein
MPSGPSAAPTSNVYLRNSFDTDPSSYMGRFVARGATDLDEGSAMPLTCSQYVSHRFVEGGGVKFTENMSVSSEIAARIGVPVVASGRASASRNAEVRVEYVLTGKMVAEITDPEAFEACCKQKPDQCTDRFIGEFLQGTGAVYREDTREASISGEGTNPTNGVNGSGSASRERSWTQAIEFPNPVYFAFKVTGTPQNRVTSSCGDWVDNPPSEPGFVFHQGMSGALRSERMAREFALAMAQERAYASVAREAPAPAGQLAEDDPDARRWALGMHIENSCVEMVPGKRPKYRARVLGKLPVYAGPSGAAGVAPVIPTPDPAVTEPPALEPEGDVDAPAAPETH